MEPNQQNQVRERVSDKEAADVTRRFKTKDSLYNYLSCRRKFNALIVSQLRSIVNVLLPQFRLCTIDFMQQIVADDKKVLFRHEVKTRKLPCFKEFSVGNLVRSQLSKQLLAAYFPDKADSVDRMFAWSVYETLESEAAERFYQSILDGKYGAAKQADKPKIALSRRWHDLLLKHQPKNEPSRRVNTNFFLKREPRTHKVDEKASKKRSLQEFQATSGPVKAAANQLKEYPKRLKIDPLAPQNP